MMPKHITYTESFLGGAAVFFAKEPAEVEVVNDINGELINFYRVLKSDYAKLNKAIDESLHSREMHKEAEIIYKHADMFDPISRAWAVWVLSKMSFASRLDGAFGYDIKKNETTKKIANAKEAFTHELAKRLEKTQIECIDGLKIIKSRDTENTFHFVDPPYVGTAMGHYKGYTDADFKNLLDVLTTVKGKFLLTMFPNKLLEQYIKKYKWHKKEIERRITASKVGRRLQTELLVTNYKV